MKKTVLSIALFAMLLAGYLFAARPKQSKATGDVKTAAGNEQGFAVVELFTSEGCSSCPPAEKVLAKLQREYKGKQVLLIEEHIDYWDKIGWKDPFSDRAFTQRQYMYAGLFNTI